MDLHNIREDYSKQELSKADCTNTPLPQFEKWLNEAIHSAAKEPTAMSVATVDEAGRPNSRILLLKEVNDRAHLFLAGAGAAGARRRAGGKTGRQIFRRIFRQPPLHQPFGRVG